MFRSPLLVVIALLALPIVAHGQETAPAHQERLQAGPYAVDVGFSEWPVRAERSVDITFAPVDGIAGKTATVALIPPSGEEWESPLGRHPRDREIWGLDLIALPQSGPWTIGLTIDGPAGTASGLLEGVPLLERPGPPVAPLWLLGILPLIFLVWLTVRAWRAVRPSRLAAARGWA